MELSPGATQAAHHDGHVPHALPSLPSSRPAPTAPAPAAGNSGSAAEAQKAYEAALRITTSDEGARCPTGLGVDRESPGRRPPQNAIYRPYERIRPRAGASARNDEFSSAAAASGSLSQTTQRGPRLCSHQSQQQAVGAQKEKQVSDELAQKYASVAKRKPSGSSSATPSASGTDSTSTSTETSNVLADVRRLLRASSGLSDRPPLPAFCLALPGAGDVANDDPVDDVGVGCEFWCSSGGFGGAGC